MLDVMKDKRPVPQPSTAFQMPLPPETGSEERSKKAARRVTREESRYQSGGVRESVGVRVREAR